MIIRSTDPMLGEETYPFNRDHDEAFMTTDLLENAGIVPKARPKRQSAKQVEVVKAEAALPAAIPTDNLLAAIVTLAKDPAVDVAKLQALMTMQERMEDRQAEREFAQALTRLAGKLPRVKKNGTISLGQGKGEIPFAKWEDMDRVIRPLLDQEGFTLSFNSEPRAGEGGGAVIVGTLLHRDGHSMKASMSLPLDTGPGRNNLQAMGSTLSYGKRYCAEMLLNIVREGADDDGVAGGKRYISAEQVVELKKLLADAESDEGKFLLMFGAQEMAGIETGAFIAARNMLIAKIGAKNQRRAS